MTDDELIDRATKAHAAYCKRKGLRFEQPSNISSVTRFARYTEIVLENVRGNIARYHYRTPQQHDGLMRGDCLTRCSYATK